MEVDRKTGNIRFLPLLARLLIGRETEITVSEIIQPFHDVFLAFPLKEFFYFLIRTQDRIHMSDQLFLYMATPSKVQMKIDACGLQIVVSQAISYMDDIFALIEQIDGAGVSEGMHRIDGL
jgi:hypothetical protein